ncbi:MAG TPA: hypothetical protein VKB43_12280 [Gaiellaceae bacterium]|nr:hypothetical protein [Gaiellaceae bacterium]
MSRVLKIGGLVSGAILIAFGIVVIVLAIDGRNTVHSELQQQMITGTPDMTPTAIQAAGKEAGLENVTYPTCTVANLPIDSGPRARCFAQYMNIHALEATGGFVYSQMGIYTAKPGAPKAQIEPGGGTNNTQYALTDPKTGAPVQNAARNVWVTETALSTALNMSYMATQLSLFSLVVGIALILSGVGFIILALGGGVSAFGAKKSPD